MKSDAGNLTYSDGRWTAVRYSLLVVRYRDMVLFMPFVLAL
jgi:hypothetical protein